MFIIKTKNKEYTGVLSGVFFINGVGQAEELSEYDKTWFEKLEATVEEEKEKEKVTEEITEEVTEELEETKEDSKKKPKKEKGK